MIFEIYRFEDLTAIDAGLPGSVHPSNVVKYAAYMAMMNANGQPIRILVATDGDLDAAAGLDSLEPPADYERMELPLPTRNGVRHGPDDHRGTAVPSHQPGSR